MIRYYCEADTEEVLNVWYASALPAYDFLPESFWADEREDIRTKYLPAAQTWVDEHNGAIVGFISLLDSHIGGLFVAPDSQGQGIGTRLIEHARTMHSSLSLDVFEQNTQARRFYEKCGFAITEESYHKTMGCAILTMQTE